MGWLFFLMWFIIIMVSGFFLSGWGRPDGLDVFMGVLLGSLINALVSTLLFIYAVSCEVKPVDRSEHELIAAGNYSGIDGGFFLGCGSVSEKPVYLYYFKAKDGSYQMGKVECSRFKIIESDEESPKIILYNKFRITQDFGWFMRSWLGPILYYNFPYKHQTGEIIVPIGTIEKLNFRKLNL